MFYISSMPLDLRSFTAPVAAVLAGYPDVELPLLKSDLRKHKGLESIARQSGKQLFPDAREPECALSGLLLLLGGWEHCHQAAQEITRREGSYWHAIAHRMEPDIWNSGYWFRRVGNHPIFEPLLRGALEINARHAEARWEAPDPWEAASFLTLCEQAASKKGSPQYQLAVSIQSLEWKLLFQYCAARPEK